MKKTLVTLLALGNLSAFAQNIPTYGSSRNPQEEANYQSRMNMINEHIEMKAKETKIEFDKILKGVEDLNKDKSIACVKIKNHWNNRLAFYSKCYDTSSDKLAVKIKVAREVENLNIQVKNKNGYLLKLPKNFVKVD